jgi:hypothetical protein
MTSMILKGQAPCKKPLEHGRWNLAGFPFPRPSRACDIETKGALKALTPMAAWAGWRARRVPAEDRPRCRRSIATPFHPSSPRGPRSPTIAPALRNYFADVVEEPLPALLAALVEKLHAAPDPQASEESEHGPSTTPTANRAGGGG